MERHDPGHARAAKGVAAGSPPGLPALRERVAADPYGRWLGIELLDLGPATAARR
jgi:hypothetical protein